MDAERAVRARMETGLPATVYRPSIVVGDSDTGYTQKYDGPYHVLRWILRQPRWAALVPVPPGAEDATVNQVPRDFVTGAVVRLSREERAEGETVHLADYFDHPARYDTTRARSLLEGSGVETPRFGDYAEAMVAFVRAHPEPPTGPLL